MNDLGRLKPSQHSSALARSVLGNAVATLVIAGWENALDRRVLNAALASSNG